MRVFVVRHGETDYNRARKMQGYQEIPLNNCGIAQAALLGERLADVGIDLILCSDLRRAVMTGCIIAARTGAPMTYLPGFRERNPGALVEMSYDDEPRFFTDPDYVPPGGESVLEFRRRVRRTFEDIAGQYGGEEVNVLVVSHGLVCHAFVDDFFGTESSDGVGSGNATLTIARYTNGQWYLEEATCGAHLTESPSPGSESTAHSERGA